MYCNFNLYTSNLCSYHLVLSNFYYKTTTKPTATKPKKAAAPKKPKATKKKAAPKKKA